MSTYPDVSGKDAFAKRKPLEPNSYILKLDDIWAETKDGAEIRDKNGDRYWKFIFVVKDYGNRLYKSFYFLDGSTGKNVDIKLGEFKQFLEAIGAKTTGGELSILLGSVCSAYVIQRPYNNEMVNDIKFFQPLETGESFGASVEEDATRPF